MARWHSLIISKSHTFTPAAAGESHFIPKLQQPNRRKRKLNLALRAGLKEKHSRQTSFARLAERARKFSLQTLDVQQSYREAIVGDVAKLIKCKELKSAQ